MLKISKLISYANQIPMWDLFSENSRSGLLPKSNDTDPNIEEEYRNFLNKFLFNSNYYDGENWYGCHLVSGHPEFIPENELMEFCSRYKNYVQ